MSVFKCKMCGGALEIAANETVVTCEYCGTQQTLPKLDDDKRANMYDRANHFRRNNEFDKAMGIYEQILNEDNTDSETYWSLVLCRYGIEYVEDPATHKRVPTVNRAQFTSVFDDDNYKSALQHADTLQKTVYEAEAKVINEIQKGILAISQKEEPFDVFICYKETDNNGRRTPDSVLANDLYHQLTQEGFKVFFSRITLEDKLGSAYEPYIFAALNSAKVMVVLGTKPEYFNAVWVKNEWARYLSLVKQSAGKKMLIPAYKDMDPYDLPEEFSHLQAQDMSKLGFMQDLIRGIKKIISADAPAKSVVKETVVVNNTAANSSISPLLKRAFMFLEDGDFNSANEYAEKVLDIDPECAEAYLVKLMAESNTRKREDLKNQPQSFENSLNYQKIIRFGDNAIQKEIKSYIEFILDRNETARKEDIYQKALAGKSKKILSGYDEAIKLFSSILGYKDSEKQIQECKDEKERTVSDVISAIIKKRNETIGNNDKKELEQKKIILKKLSDLELVFCSITDTINSLSGKKQDAENRIEQLEAEKKSLGLFAGKQKKAIQEKIKELNKQLYNTTEEINQNTEQLMGYKSLEDIQQNVALIKKEIIRLEDITTTIQSKNIITFEQAVKMCKNDDVLNRIVYEKFPGFMISYSSIGDTIVFGRYTNSDIEWIILAKENNKALVTSKYALDCKQYNTSDSNVTWETCTLRKWLNNNFINTAFSKEEKSMIPTVTVSADRNPEYNTNPGNATQDKVFLLSIAEAKKYFKTDESRKCVPTDYAIAQGAYTNNDYTVDGKATCWWWLRSPGPYQLLAAFVDDAGSISYDGDYVFYDDVCVRPALWITLNS